MKSLLLILSLISFAAQAHAGTDEVLAKVQKRVHSLRTLNTKLLKIMVSPAAPKQGDTVTLFTQLQSGFQDSEVLLSARLNNVPAALERPTQQMWIHSAGAFSEIRNHQFKVTIYIRDAGEAAELRAAIKAVDLEIASLNDQIDAETDPELRDQLIAQRDLKYSQRSALNQALIDLRTPIGTQQLSFSIAENTLSPDFPRITAVSPTAGPIGGGTTVTVTGANFGSAPTLKIGGVEMTVTSSTSTNITAVTPAFADEGVKTVEVRHTDAGVPKNTFLRNAFFVSASLNEDTNDPPVMGMMLYGILDSGNPTRVAFAAPGSQDPNGQIVSYQWNFGDGTPSRFGDAQGEGSIEHEFLGFGTYTVSVTATDNEGASTVLEQEVTVNSVEIPLSQVQMDQVSGAAPLTVTFTSSVTAVSPVSAVGWSYGDGSGEIGFGSEYLVRTHTFNNPGIYNVFNQVATMTGGYARHIVRVYVGTAPPVGGTEPVAHIRVDGSRQVLLGNSVLLNGTGSFDPNPGAGSLTYSWNLGDFFNCPGDGCSATTASVNHTYGGPGNFFARLEVTGSGGTTSFPHYLEILTVNQGNAPRAVNSISQTEGVVPLNVNFDGTGSYDGDGILTAYSWNFGDYAQCPNGCTSSGATASYNFTSPGVYMVALEVTDDDGNKHTRWDMVTVNAGLVTLGAIKPRSIDTGNISDREIVRRQMMGACGRGDGRACFGLSQMYQEEGDLFRAGEFLDLACLKGYQPACSEIQSGGQ